MPPTKRESDLARARAKRLAEARAAQAKRRRVWYAIAAGVCAVLLVVVIILAASSGGGSKKTATPAATPSAAATTAAVACGAKAPPAPKLMTFSKAPPVTIDKTAKYTMTMNTSCGTIVISMDAAKTPQTVNSFAFLASKGYFNGIHFSRSSDTGFKILQGGDQSSDGTGGPGYTIPDENLANASYPRGAVAMANTGAANSGSSQFFLLASDANSVFSKTYTSFGTITSGLPVLDKIIALGNDGSNSAGGGKPKQTVYINTLTVTKG